MNNFFGFVAGDILTDQQKKISKEEAKKSFPGDISIPYTKVTRRYL